MALLFITAIRYNQESYEVYDLKNDISQQKDIFDDNEDAQLLQKAINRQLEQIQSNGYYWEDLPPDRESKYKKQKKDWVKID